MLRQNFVQRLPYAARCFHSSSSSCSGSSSNHAHKPASELGILEIREYTLHPAGSKPFMQLAAENAQLRKQLLPFLGCASSAVALRQCHCNCIQQAVLLLLPPHAALPMMFTCDVGGDLNKVTHFYHYKYHHHQQQQQRQRPVAAAAAAPAACGVGMDCADLEQREELRAAAAKNFQWQAFIDASRPHVAKQAWVTCAAVGPSHRPAALAANYDAAAAGVATAASDIALLLLLLLLRQESRIMVEAGSIYSAVGRSGAAAFRSPPQTLPNTPVYEFRQYQLHPGYGSVPKLMAAFADGLPEKVAADREGLLVAFAHSDIGILNQQLLLLVLPLVPLLVLLVLLLPLVLQVIELWRYPSAAACVRARVAARSVKIWRETIAAVTPGVQHFQTSLLLPTKFSPWQ
eukprot:gene15155-biopygen1975